MPVLRPRSLRPMLVAMLLASASLRAQVVGAASPSAASDEIRVGVNRGWTDYRDRHLGPELKEMKNLQYQPSGLEVYVAGNSAWVLFRYSLKADVNGRAADVVGLGTAGDGPGVKQQEAANRGEQMRRSRKIMRMVPAVLLALALPVHTASAHPRLLRAAPAAESHVTRAPREIALSFNEAVSVALSRLTLLDAAKRAVKLDSLRPAPRDAKTLTAKVLGALRPGRYSVKWQAGGADGHPMRGEYTFVVD